MFMYLEYLLTFIDSSGFQHDGGTHRIIQLKKYTQKGDVFYSCAISVLYVRRFLLNGSRDANGVGEHIQFPYIYLKALNLRKVPNDNNSDHLVRDFM